MDQPPRKPHRPLARKPRTSAAPAAPIAKKRGSGKSAAKNAKIRREKALATTAPAALESEAAPKLRASRHVPAKKTQTTEQEFVALLRRYCIRAATIGALTAAAEAVPGLGRLVRLVSGELIDAALLSSVQRELIEKTFELYEVRLPDVIRKPLIERVQVLGSGAALSGDAFLRRMLKSGLGKVGGLLVSRAAPVLPIVTSASTNAAVTYAIGKRAQAVAKLKDASLADVGDVVRAFTGVDERRIYAWTGAAVKDALGATGKLFGRIAALPSRVVARARGKKSED